MDRKVGRDTVSGEMQHCSTLIGQKAHPSEKGQILKLPRHCYKLSRRTPSPGTQCWEQAPSESPNSHRAGVEDVFLRQCKHKFSPRDWHSRPPYRCRERVTKCTQQDCLKSRRLTYPQHETTAFQSFIDLARQYACSGIHLHCHIL